MGILMQAADSGRYPVPVGWINGDTGLWTFDQCPPIGKVRQHDWQPGRHVLEKLCKLFLVVVVGIGEDRDSRSPFLMKSGEHALVRHIEADPVKDDSGDFLCRPIDCAYSTKCCHQQRRFRW